MANSNRTTILPHSLDDLDVATHCTQETSDNTPRRGNPSSNTSLLDPRKKSTVQYHKSCYVDQAGEGVIALRDVDSLPVCLIKEHPGRVLHSLPSFSHKNLVTLLDCYYSRCTTYLVYEYEHFAISLGCAAASVHFNEADIATICKELLQGLEYIHHDLKVAHGHIDCSNILITQTGGVKIANVGNSLIKRCPKNLFQADIKAVGAIVIFLSDRKALISESTDGPSELSHMALSFIKKTENSPLKKLLKDDFLDLANPGGTWSLKRHYFDALPLEIRISHRLRST